MKIVQILPELNEGGVERGTVELSRELVKLGHKSIVISNGGKLAPQIEADGGANIKFDVCSKNILTVPYRVYGLRKLLKELDPDIVHVRSRVPAWLVYLAKKGLNFKVVSTVHGFNSAGLYSSIMTKADAVICVSNSIKLYIQKQYHTSGSKITVIPRGIDTVQFNPNKIDHSFVGQFSKQYDLNGKFVVSAVGRITQLKDLETFIRAVAIVKVSMPNVKALIVGGVRENKRGYFHSLQHLTEELELQDQVVFAGSQSNVAEIYALSDVVVNSSKKPESFGRSVAEAIAMNTPVIATNHGGVLDIIRVGIDGFLIEAGDADALSRQIIGSMALKFDGFGYIKENFSLEQMVTRTMAVYGRLA